MTETMRSGDGPRLGRIKSWIIDMTRGVSSFVLIPNLKGEEGRNLRLKVYDDGALTPGYMLMCALSSGIAALGLLQSSTAVVIGAMLVSPLMTPIVALGFAFASFDGKRIQSTAKVVAIGAAIGIIVAMLLTWLSPIRNVTPEIIARTEPTLLDLAIALLSGLAGGYAIVQRTGATAIGVAIATALMPPLAVVGYGLGVGRMDFAGGALLLFLTNLAAISFAIGLIARLSGAARPFGKAEMGARAIFMGLVAFFALATPLALTLVRVSHEATARAEARRILASVLEVRNSDIAQLDVKWPLRGEPIIDAVVIAGSFKTEAKNEIVAQLKRSLKAMPTVNLQQVVAADVQSQTRALVDAAMERTVAGISNDVPPFSEIQAALGIPVLSLWTNRPERIANVVPAVAPEWTLADYRDSEAEVAKVSNGWKVYIIPPVQTSITISGEREVSDTELELAIWAMQRWGLREASIKLSQGDMEDSATQTALTALIARFSGSDITMRGEVVPGRNQITISVFGLSPSQRRAVAAEQLIQPLEIDSKTKISVPRNTQIPANTPTQPTLKP